MKASLYARVSTAEQKTMKAQLEELRRYATARGWEVTHEVKEVGSGASHRTSPFKASGATNQEHKRYTVNVLP